MKKEIKSKPSLYKKEILDLLGPKGGHIKAVAQVKKSLKK